MLTVSPTPPFPQLVPCSYPRQAISFFSKQSLSYYLEKGRDNYHCYLHTFYIYLFAHLSSTLLMSHLVNTSVNTTHYKHYIDERCIYEGANEKCMCFLIFILVTWTIIISFSNSRIK